MANPLKGEASFHDGEVEHKIVINWGVLIEVEDESGVPLLSPDLWRRIGFISSLLRHGLHAAGGRLISRTDAAEMIAKVEGIPDALKKAFNAAMPKDESEGDQGSVGGNA
jgi:hypothetical protein